MHEVFSPLAQGKTKIPRGVLASDLLSLPHVVEREYGDFSATHMASVRKVCKVQPAHIAIIRPFAFHTTHYTTRRNNAELPSTRMPIDLKTRDNESSSSKNWVNEKGDSQAAVEFTMLIVRRGIIADRVLCGI